MNVEQSVCASSGKANAWEQMDWPKCERQVRRLQARIVKATQEGRWDKVKALQRLQRSSSFCETEACTSRARRPASRLWKTNSISSDKADVQESGMGFVAQPLALGQTPAPWQKKPMDYPAILAFCYSIRTR